VANKEISAVDNVPWEDSGLKADRLDGNMTLKAIHEPSGVVEFAPLILTLYAGCSHDCWYCYNKIGNRRQDLPYDQPAKKASLVNIQYDLTFLKQIGRNSELVLISNMGDPYDMGRGRNRNRPKGLMKHFSEDELKANPGLKEGYIHTRIVLNMLRNMASLLQF
jgi:hypothetical protein